MHSFGATISILTGTVTGPGSSSDLTMSQTNLTYFPRYNFIENENSSVSIGLPVGIGVGIVTSTFGDDAGISFAYDLPVVVDYNIGCRSTMENDKNFGGYLGVGFGYYKVSISQSQYSDFSGATYGPMFRGGLRFREYEHAITVGLFFKKGLEKNKLTSFGFNVLYDL